MPALELLSGYVTAPSTTLTALTMNGSDSKTIRSFPPGSKAHLFCLLGLNQTAGYFEIKAPKFHDNVRGIRVYTGASSIGIHTPADLLQPLYPQETLSMNLSGSATGGDIEIGGCLVYYEDLPGASANLAHWNEIKDRIRHIFPVISTLTMGTAGSYSGEKAINNDIDLFKSNTEYALIGFHSDSALGAIGWRGIDTGNMRVGAPCAAVSYAHSLDWFKYISDKSGLPCIPIFNSANKSAIFIDGVNNENANTVITYSIFAELS